jgi:hypothetical protein
MQSKKKLITRFALWAAATLVVGAVTGAAGLLMEEGDRARFEEQQERAKQKRLESSRAYLAELAKRVNRLPVDATLVSEIESRYFEEHANGPFYVWALDTRGEFAFGVPQSAFRKVNAIYDSEVTPRLKEGIFLDRQTFLMSLIDDSDEIGPELVSDDKAVLATELVNRGRRFQINRWEPENAFVLSAPLKAADGSALGSLYLKRTAVREQTWYNRDRGVEVLAAAGGMVALASLFFLWVLLPTWIYVDARERGVRRAPLFAFLAVISSLVGLIVYLIARPEEPRRLTCPGCAREVNGGAFCPHCGRDLASSFCPACRYPLKSDWAFCPACRAELKTPPAAPTTPVPEAG